MTNVFPVVARSGSVPARIIHRVIAALGRIPDWFIALAARFFPAAVFWQSGETKVAGWHLKPSAISLFENEYQLPLIDPTIAAYVSAFSEHFFPILLVIGLATRFSALALLCMTVVIEIFVYPGAWPTHGVWATCLLVVIARGPGWLSLDHLIARKYQ
ncbi:DoxX family protein [Bradyrhizobium erythrophlei]|jgi:putative oxidoreductase|uniref:Putative oxidoreductase n=1 Tax=Bradyrhizobium erythrophlei TaxID=1437360 RepID=A0A1M5TMI3_9BRAD|nr:DoxX family protein [Bradyrhizobium erythrophlei]SHH51876.1 putative oxidoreductase [Bradyrhizobium erythrophlei]